MTGPQARRDAPALRFLLLCLGGWAAMRAVMNWGPAVPALPEAAQRPVATAPVVEAAAEVPGAPLCCSVAKAGGHARQRHAIWTPAFAGAREAVRRPVLASDRAEGASIPGDDMPPSIPPKADADAPPRFGLTSDPPSPPMAGWSLGGWLYLRGDAIDGLAAGGQIGGSQAGVRLAYGFGENGRTQAYARATVAVRRPRQRELAFGVAHRPVATLPVDVAIERRVAIGHEGRDAFALMAVGGVSEVALPAGFRLDAYAQAGVVGVRRRDGFADGALVIDRPLGLGALRLGALAAGAIQPDARRIDAGPRLTLGLPQVGKGARVALDWRQRIAGGARPDSGMALTLAGDF